MKSLISLIVAISFLSLPALSEAHSRHYRHYAEYYVSECGYECVRECIYKTSCYQPTCCNEVIESNMQPIYKCKTEYRYHHGRNRTKIEVCYVYGYTCSNFKGC